MNKFQVVFLTQIFSTKKYILGGLGQPKADTMNDK